jgi:hypothetical protein
MNIKEIFESIKNNKAENYKLYLVDSDSGKMYIPLVTRNNEVKLAVNIEKFKPEKEHLIPIPTMGDFVRHLQRNCKSSADVWVNIYQDKQHYISSAEDMEDSETACFHITEER